MSVRLIRISTVALLVVASAICAGGCRQHRVPPPDAAGSAISDMSPVPEWVFRHWVWEDESTQESALALVRGYRERGIPVGAVVIDSPWETGYNTFRFDPARFPAPREMIDELHRMEVRVVLWITPIINLDSPNYAEAVGGGFLVDSGGPIRWWKGEGAFIDYTNPDALAWWHAQMDPVLDMGIDGWKCDGAEVYIPRGRTLLGRGGPVDPVRYQEMYYRDFFDHTRARLGTDRVILARGVDTMPFPLGRTRYAPRDVNFAAWAGDQHPTWGGLRSALDNVLRSARDGYLNVGCDVGGYFGDGNRDEELWIRWVQLGAWLPLFENGGMGEHRPWEYGDEALAIYRRFAALHESLVPYLAREGARCFREGRSLVTPIDMEAGTYILGDSFFVAPILGPGGRVIVTLPPGDWLDFWTREPRSGETTFELEVGLDRYPIYIRSGADMPMPEAFAGNKVGASF